MSDVIIDGHRFSVPDQPEEGSDRIFDQHFQSPWRGLRDPELTSIKELRDRYGHPITKKETEQSLEAFFKDLGLDAYRVPVKTPPQDEISPFNAAQNTLGVYHPGPGNMTLYPSGLALDTGSHEIAHMADETLGKFSASDASNNPDSSQYDAHHKYYKNFDTDIGQQLEAQRSIEQGNGADPQDYAKFPWLMQVNPQSSNRIANPWSFNHDQSEVPAWLWNLEQQKPGSGR